MRACLIFSASAVSALGGFHNANVGPLGRMQAPAGRRGRGHVGDSDPSRMPAVVASSERRVLPRRRPSRRSCSPDDRHHATDRETPVVVVIINGTAPGLIVTNIYRVPSGGFRDDDAKNDDGRVATDAMVSLSDLFTAEDMTRLRLSSHDVTLPAALMLLDPTKYPTQSRARKAIRQRSICICRHRGGDVCAAEKNETLEFDELGKVIARVHPGDVIGFQRRAGSDYYAVEGVPYRPPPFEVPVIFEDDHMAIVNKPAGIVVYRAEGGRGGGARAGGHGRDTLLSALSFVLMPSNFTSGGGENDGDDDDGERNRPLKRPHPVHRLDRPTSGLMVIAKTKGAAVHLAQQFEYRKARKTYCAIVNGAPIMSPYHEDGGSYSEWNTIDHDLEEKSAITEWRRIKKIRSLRGKDGQLSLLELRPRTGRYHQLRRHMAWVCKSPIIGDTTYDDADDSALRFRERGLFLCSNEVELEHPYYNTPSGRKVWHGMDRRVQSNGDAILREDEGTGMVTVKARIDLPEKFQSFIDRENSRANKFMDEDE